MNSTDDEKYDASVSASDEQNHRVSRSRPHTISNGQLRHNYNSRNTHLLNESTNQPIVSNVDKYRPHSSSNHKHNKSYSNSRKRQRRTSDVIQAISEKVANVSQNGLYSLRAFADNVTDKADKLFNGNKINSTRNANFNDNNTEGGITTDIGNILFGHTM